MNKNKNLRNAVAGLALGMSVFALTGCSSPFGSQDQAETAKADTAVVDYEIVVNQHPKVAEAKTKMDQEYKALQESMNPDELAKLSPEERQARIADAQKMISNKEVEFFKPIETNVNESMDAVMKEKGIKVLLDKRAVVRGGVDVTKDILIKEGVSASDADRIIAGVPKDAGAPPIDEVAGVGGGSAAPVVPQ